MGRRGHGEGYIKKRKDGMLIKQISFGFDGVGKRVRKAVVGKTKEELLEAERKLRNEYAQKGFVPTTKITTLGEYLDEWLKQTKSSIRASTYHFYETMVRLHIKPYIAKLRIGKIQKPDIVRFYLRLEELDKSPRIRKAVHQTLKVACNYAVDMQIMTSSPMDRIKTPQYEARKMKIWSPQDIDLFLKAAASNFFFVLFVLALDTGMRQGELFGLRWADIDFKNRKVTVERSLSEVRGVYALGQTKNGKTRIIDISDTTVAALKEYKKQLTSAGRLNDELMFFNEAGSYLNKKNFDRHVWKKLLREAAKSAPEGYKFTRIRFHDMRHTVATVLLEKGIQPHVVSERLGHSSVQITLQIYAHVLPSQQRQAADVMEQSLKEQHG